MKLQQLKYIVEVANNDLNVTTAAERLHTSQPGVSKHIRQLEDELGVRVFERSGKQLSAITPVGQAIIEHAEHILREVNSIERITDEYLHEAKGKLRLGTTHTQARYVLPATIKAFSDKYPQVSLQIQQGSPRQIASWAAHGEVDFAIATEAMDEFEDLVQMPCYHWNRSLVLQPDHPLAKQKKVAIEDLARCPIVTYVRGFTGRSKFDSAFIDAGLKPKVVLTAVDADVIKTYVRSGLGVGVVANMAYDEAADSDLVRKDLGHIFTPNTTNICYRRGAYLRHYMYDFVEMFCSHLTREHVDAAALERTQELRRAYFTEISKQLPVL